MATRIRLARHGKKGKPFFHIVIADQRAKRDGRYIQKIGDYNPNVNPAIINLDVDVAVDWLEKGAQPSDTVRAILSYKGAMYKHHLVRGVAKGAFNEAEMEKRFNAWLAQKDAKVQKKADGLTADDESAKKKQLAAEKEISNARAKEIAEKNSALAAELAAAEAPVEEPATEEAPAAEVTTETPVAEAAAPVEEAKEAPEDDKKEA